MRQKRAQMGSSLILARISQGFQPERPSVASITAEKPLLYAGRLNEIHAEPGVGKTNLAVLLCIATLNEGGHVLFLDPEDTPLGILQRLKSFGADMGAVAERFHYLHDPMPEQLDQAIDWTRKHRPRLVVFDGLAEALASERKDENNVTDVLTFFRGRLRPFAELGAAVVTTDHVTKTAEGRGRWARGSGAKLGRYDGVSYSAQPIDPYSPDQAGKVRLRIAKDRNGGVGGCGKIVGVLSFAPDGTGITRYDFTCDVKAKSNTHAALKAKSCSHLAEFPNATKNDLRKLGKHEWVDRAVNELVDEGQLSVSKQGQRNVFTLREPYREAA